MTTQVTLPQLGESVDSGTIVAWLVEPGDEVEPDQAVAEISTDKVDTEIPSPAGGTVTRLLAEVGAEIEVGAPLFELDGDGTVPPATLAQEPDTTEPSTPSAEDATRAIPTTDDEDGSPTGESSAAAATGSGTTSQVLRPAAGRWSPRVRRLLGEHGLRPAEVTGTGDGGRVTPHDVLRAAEKHRLSPKVKRLLEEHRLEPSSVEGTGANGRITPEDVLSAADRRPSDPVPSDTRTTSSPPPTHVPRQVRELPEGSRVETLSRTRSIIAARMLESLQTTAQLTAAVEADVTRLMRTRSAVKDAYQRRYGASLSPLAFIARATVRTLQRHPILNASIDTEAGEAIFHSRVHLGFAVDAPQGLMVPKVPDAQDLTVAGLQRRITDLAQRARDRKLRPDELHGGTFTITNTGSRGSLFDTPILNPPEVGILATPTIEKRPVVVEDEFGNETFAVRQRTYLCLTYDHRLVDGADAARFLSDLAADLDTTDWDGELAELA